MVIRASDAPGTATLRRKFILHLDDCDRRWPSPKLQQVLINLILNGTQAMAGQTTPRRLLVATRVFSDDHAHVIVEDSGPGISEDSAGQIFNAFFTTKADGMGMSLSICRSIVEAHGGRIWAEPAAQGGASLQLILPVDRGRCHEHPARQVCQQCDGLCRRG